MFSPGELCWQSERAGDHIIIVEIGIILITVIFWIIIIILIITIIIVKQVGRLLGYSGVNLAGEAEGAMAAITGYEVIIIIIFFTSF